MTIHIKCHIAYEKNISGSGNIVKYGRAIIDATDTSEIMLEDDLILGENIRKNSSAETYLKLHENSRLIVRHKYKAFFGSSIELIRNAVLTLGQGYINTGGAIACAKSISIGNGVFIGRNTYITDSDHHVIYDTNRNVLNEPMPVCIKDHVLIGYGAVVLKGVTIGDGSVIGASSIVTSDIPPKCLAVGNPARVIREGIEWR